MAALKKYLGTWVFAFVVMGIFILTSMGMFLGKLKDREQVLLEKKSMLASMKMTLGRREKGESLLQEYVPQGAKSSEPDEALNAWVNDLVAFGKTAEITFKDLQPERGTGTQNRMMSLSLVFSGPPRDLMRLLEYLLEKEPLSQIDFLSMKAGENRQTYEYSFVLKRNL